VAASVVRDAQCAVLVTREFPVNVERWARATDLTLAVGLDGTPASEGALAWLHSQGERLGHQRFLIRVFWPPREALRYGLPESWLDLDPHPALMRLIDRELRRTLAPVGGEQGAQVRFRAAHVNSATVLAEEAGNAGADAIVIGVAGKGVPAWQALDVQEVLRATPCPVLCIPGRAVSTTRLIQPVRSVLVASDLSDRARAAMPRAYSLLREAGGQVELLHVHAPLSGAGALSTAPVGDPLPDARRHDLQRQLRASVPQDADVRGIVTRTHVLEGDAAEVILQTAERLGVDVVALASHGRSGLGRALLGSVAEQVARHSPRPVLIIHQPETP
jgi:nucleotide-binding universal stress UspA family protein